MGHEIMVSVCILCYNHAKTIKKAINSVLEQRVSFTYEVIVGDDCSTDRTPEILRTHFKNKITIIARKKNVGATKNCADIVKRAKGKYIIFLEGDDYWEINGTFQYMVDFLEKNQNFEGISGKRKKIDYKDRIIGDNTDFKATQRILTLEKYLNNETFDLPATLFKNRRERFDLLTEIKGSRNRGDLVWAILILENGPLFKTKKYIGFYRCINRTGHKNYNSQYTKWEKYVEVIHILKCLEKYHTPRHSYMKRYLKESKLAFSYIVESKQIHLLNNMIILLGPIKFIQIGLLLAGSLFTIFPKDILRARKPNNIRC